MPTFTGPEEKGWLLLDQAIRGLVRRNVASNRLIRLHSWPCAEERESGGVQAGRGRYSWPCA